MFPRLCWVSARVRTDRLRHANFLYGFVHSCAGPVSHFAITYAVRKRVSTSKGLSSRCPENCRVGFHVSFRQLRVDGGVPCCAVLGSVVVEIVWVIVGFVFVLT